MAGVCTVWCFSYWGGGALVGESVVYKFSMGVYSCIQSNIDSVMI